MALGGSADKWVNLMSQLYNVKSFSGYALSFAA
jgi:hypothetical protein